MTTNIIKLFMILLVANYIIAFPSVIIFDVIGFEFSQDTASSLLAAQNPFQLRVFIVPHIEEVIFRWLPMLLLVFGFDLFHKNKANHDKIKKYLMFGVLFLFCFPFGYMHGNLINMLFIQGPTGMFCSAIYYRTYWQYKNDLKITKFQLIPLGSATLFHTLWNLINCSLIIILGLIGVLCIWHFFPHITGRDKVAK